MADLTQTRANVRLVSGTARQLNSGEAILQGEPIREENGALFKSRNNTANNARFDGIALSPATAAGQPVVYAPPGSVVDLGATLGVSDLYILSSTAGAIAPITDLASNNFLTVISVGLTASTALVTNLVTGIQKPV
jgi:hypothetical protein